MNLSVVYRRYINKVVSSKKPIILVAKKFAFSFYSESFPLITIERYAMAGNKWNFVEGNRFDLLHWFHHGVCATGNVLDRI